MGGSVQGRYPYGNRQAWAQGQGTMLPLVADWEV